MKHLLLTAASAALAAAPYATFAADELPTRIQFARYEPMMDRSPFAVATAAAATPPPAPNFAKDWYIANAARSPQGDLVTIASSTDKNFKLYLTSAEPVNGVSISNTEWSDKVGATKVTVTKDGQFATLTFNQALLSQPIANAPAPQQQPQVQPQPGQPQVAGGQPALPTPAGMPPGGAPANAPIKPAPIPTLPTPPPRVRSVIQRNPGAAPTAPQQQPVAVPNEDS